MEVAEEFGDEVAIIGIPGLEDNLDDMREFVAETGTAGIVHLPDPDGELWMRFGVSRQRTYVIVEADGSRRTEGYGSLPEDVAALAAS